MRKDISIKVHLHKVRPCYFCGVDVEWPGGPVLVVTRNDQDRAVCLDCGREEAPSLTALLTLEKATMRYSRNLSDKLLDLYDLNTEEQLARENG